LTEDTDTKIGWNSEFMAQTRAILMSTLRRMLEPSEAEEVMQEAYLKVFVALNEGRPIEARPFLFKVARNLAISRLRHHKVVEAASEQVQQYQQVQMERVSTERQASLEQEQALLLQAVNALPPVCRQVFVFRKFEGKSHAEIALAMNISNKTVENHLTKGMRLCREYLQTSRSNSYASEPGDSTVQGLGKP
jgi:RNA polymerase sigma-70 factor (ECF subfamily)